MTALGSFVVQVFLVIDILMNVVNAEHGDVNKCQGQLYRAFGGCQTATDCLRYAVRYYIMEYTGSSYDIVESSLINNSNVIRDTNLIQSSSSSYNILESSEYNRNSNTDNQSFDGQSSGQDDQSINNQPFGQVQADQSINNEPFDQVQADIELYVDNFEGLQAFIESDSNRNQNVDVPPSGPNVTPERVFNYAKHFRTTLTPMVSGIDYATLFHNELYSLIRGRSNIRIRGVPNRNDFCHQYFNPPLVNPDLCLGALNHFGNSQISAVRTAFTSYTLAECKYLQGYFPYYKYVTLYMSIIINKCEIGSPKTPLKFCQDTVQKIYNLV